MRTILSLSAIFTALALSGPVVAQAPAPAAPPAHQGILGGILHHHSHPMIPATGTAPITGGIVGNKKSHVYHLPGDKGSLPSAQNRIYFRTEAEAAAAGYHKVGSPTGKTHSVTHPKPLTHPTAPTH